MKKYIFPRNEEHSLKNNIVLSYRPDTHLLTSVTRKFPRNSDVNHINFHSIFGQTKLLYIFLSCPSWSASTLGLALSVKNNEKKKPSISKNLGI